MRFPHKYSYHRNFVMEVSIWENPAKSVRYRIVRHSQITPLVVVSLKKNKHLY